MKLVNAVAAMLVVGAIGVHVPTVSAQTVKIGFISTLSGPSAGVGTIRALPSGLWKRPPANSRAVPPAAVTGHCTGSSAS